MNDSIRLIKPVPRRDYRGAIALLESTGETVLLKEIRYTRIESPKTIKIYGQQFNSITKNQSFVDKIIHVVMYYFNTFKIHYPRDEFNNMV